jgi:hypothetical protein
LSEYSSTVSIRSAVQVLLLLYCTLYSSTVVRNSPIFRSLFITLVPEVYMYLYSIPCIFHKLLFELTMETLTRLVRKPAPMSSLTLIAVILLVVSDSLNNAFTVGFMTSPGRLKDTLTVPAYRRPLAKFEHPREHLSAIDTTREVTWVGIPHGDDDGRQPSFLGFMRFYWRHNRFCDTFKDSNYTRQRLNITLGCREMHERGIIGTGNYMTGLYGLRLAATVLKVDLHLSCEDASETSTLLVLPWLLGDFPATDEALKLLRTSTVEPPSIQQVCSTYNKVPISFLLEQMKFDLRRMALSLVGIPSSSNHPAAKWALQHLRNASNPQYPYEHQLPSQHDNPLLSETDLDDVAVHFRCGDIMIGSASGVYYGFQKFHEIARYISPAASSIGIVTQPFADDESDNRTRETFKSPLDRSIGNRCRVVVEALVDYLQESFPRAIIRIHNGKNENVALAYTRMLMANQTIAASMSSFAVFPVVSTFGTGYLPQPRRGGSPYGWIDQSPRLKHITDNVVFMKPSTSSMITGMELRAMWDAKGETLALEWFRNASLVLLCDETKCRMATS